MSERINSKPTKMTKLFFVLTILFIAASAPAQNCNAPLSSIDFQQKINQLSAIRQDQRRLDAAADLTRKSCLLTYQVKQIAELFTEDFSRLTFIQNAYPSLFDKENVYDLYDVFAHFSSVMRLHDFIATQPRRMPQPAPDVMEKTRPLPAGNNPHNDNKPVRDDRTGNHQEPPCRISDADFQDIRTTIKGQTFENTQITLAKQIVSTKKCFSTVQIKELLGIFSFEKNKLEMAKYCYPYCIDRDDYYKINTVFTFSTSVDDLTKFINEQK